MWFRGSFACCKDINDNKTDCNKYRKESSLNDPRFGLLIYFNKTVLKAGYIVSLCGNLAKITNIFLIISSESY